MYIVGVQKYGYEPRYVLAEDLKELRAIVTLAPEANYDILSVDKTNFEYGKEYLAEINEEIKPEDMVFGDKEQEESEKEDKQ